MKMDKRIDAEQMAKEREKKLIIDPRKAIRQYHSFI
jgi:hypothetical protein